MILPGFFKVWTVNKQLHIEKGSWTIQKLCTTQTIYWGFLGKGMVVENTVFIVG